MMVTADRRRHERKVKPFYVAFSPDGTNYLPAYGTDISDGGIAILSQLLTPDGEFKLRIMIEQRDFVVTVRRRRLTEQLRDGKTWYDTGAEFVSVEPGDRAFVHELVSSLQVPKNTAELSTLEHTFGGPVGEKIPPAENAREAKRKRKPFYIAVSVNDLVFIPAYGLDISRTGMRIFTDGQMPAEPFKIRIILRDREFLVTAKKQWDSYAEQGTKKGWITGASFTAVEPIDREFIDCYVEDKPFFPGNKLLEALEHLRLQPDRADLWLPPELLTSFLEQLVELKRLAPLSKQFYPLVKYHYEGKQTRGDAQVYIVHVESRVRFADGIKRFSTRFGFDQTGSGLHVL